MRIVVKAKPKSSKVFVKRTGATTFKVAVKEAPEKGKANEAVIKALADCLNLAASKVNLTSGHASRVKVFEVDTTLEEIESNFTSAGQIQLL